MELIERQRVERERLLEKIKQAEEKAREKARGIVNSAAEIIKEETESQESSVNQGTNGVEKVDKTDDTSSRKAHLQKMLTDLQNKVSPHDMVVNHQAKAMNIPPSEYNIPPLSDIRTKPNFRGAYRGRGVHHYPRGRGRGGAASSRSLDLRPKSIFVAGTTHETSIREWVIMNCADATCESSSEDPKGVIVKFKERYEAEEVCSLG